MLWAETIEVITRTHDVRENHPAKEQTAAIVASAHAAKYEGTAAGEADTPMDLPDTEEAAACVSPAGVVEAEKVITGPANEEDTNGSSDEPCTKRKRVDSKDKIAAPITPKIASSLITKPYADMRGHTGFLLFASKHAM
ncbi:MAG: hypothetical protein SGPRY_012380 [Prymnesium sp.]